MPYAGIPTGSPLEAKIERCVERVMAGGETDKSAAIAICRANIKMDEKEKTADVIEPTIQGKEMAEIYDPVMGVMSFAELDAMERAQEQHGKLRRIIDNFGRMARNIVQNPGIDPMDRSAALRDLTEEMRMRLDADFERGERTISMPTINGKLDPVYLEKLSKSDEVFDLSTITTNTGFKVLKALDGSYRWLGWVSNKFIDREGEILTEDAHKDYIAWLDKHPKAAGQLWTFHVPGTQRKHKADFWAYLNGFLVVGGKLTPSEAKTLEAYEGDLGMSHGFYVLQKEGNLIKKYRTFEYTVLPRNVAANPWTKFDVKELKNMTDKGLSSAQREMLAKLHGEDFAAALEDGTKKNAEVLESAGIQSKQKEDGSVDTKAAISNDAELVEEVSAEDVEIAKYFDANELAAGVAELVIKQLNPEGLQEAIKAVHTLGEQNATAIENMTKRLEALEASDDEKLAKELSPRITGIDWMGGFRASQAKETVVTEQEKETFEKAKPNESWVTDAFRLGG